MLNTKYDLGLRTLVPEWKSFFSPKYFKEDFTAGLTVACIAIPLSLAIALASGVSPAVGLITAIVGSIVCAIFGGTPLSVSGPAAAMSVLIAANVQQFGLSGLLCIGVICGVLQLFSGVFGFGTLMKFVPLPVIGGFTAGIGAIILIGQLPRAFDLPPPDQSHVLSVLTHVGNLFLDINILAVALTVISFAIIHFLPKLYSKLPAPLIAITIPTLILYFMPSKEIDLIGEIPRSLPLPTFPSFDVKNLPAIMIAGVSVYFLASLETLLSSSAVDKMVKTQKHDSNQELIGQGLGNIASAIFGGIPVTGVIARTALNINSGAKTRRASILHALVLIACIFAFAPVIKYIPLPALAGVLISVAAKMLDFKAFFSLFKISKSDAYIFIITFATIIFTDLLLGVQAGMVAAAVIALIKISKPNIFVDTQNTSAQNQVIRCSINGPLTFVSIGKVDNIQSELSHAQRNQTVIVDIAQITNMDMSGAAALIDLCSTLRTKEVNIILKGVSKQHKRLLLENSDNNEIPAQIVHNEPDLLNIVGQSSDDLSAVISRLIHGAQVFKNNLCDRSDSVFQNLASSQSPHTLFISCSDSRINPTVITATEPGELFVVRNVGNVIPKHEKNQLHSEYAALEFAINHLKVKTIVICSHTNCGAVQAACQTHKKNTQNNGQDVLSTWLSHVYVNHETVAAHELDMKKAVKENALHQTQNLLDYPLVKEKLATKDLAIFTWFYDIGKSEVQIFNHATQSFVDVSEFEHEGSPEIIGKPVLTSV